MHESSLLELLGRATRCRAEPDLATRWLAFALLAAEKGFRRISGHSEPSHRSGIAPLVG